MFLPLSTRGAARPPCPPPRRGYMKTQWVTCYGCWTSWMAVLVGNSLWVECECGQRVIVYSAEQVTGRCRVCAVPLDDHPHTQYCDW